jgi:hypothetical protein
MKLYMFRTVPLSIIRSFSLCTQQWHMSYRFADSCQAGSGCNCNSILILLDSCLQTCMTYTIAVCIVENSWCWIEELAETYTVSFQNKFQKLVHLVGFIKKICHDARSHERQFLSFLFSFNISGFHIVVLFNLSEEKVHIPSNTTK